MLTQSITDIIAVLRQYPLVPVFYHGDLAYTQNILKSCYEGGMRAFEYTNRGEKAREVFPELKKFVAEQCPGMLLGIGTIYKPEDAEYFIQAGADFVVQPVTTAAVADVCHKHSIPWLPAAATLNEIFHARELGAAVVKIFPGNVLGPGFIKAVKGPMPDANLMVTGGVEPNQKNLQEWFSSGILCAGLGSQLFTATDGSSSDDLSKRIAEIMSFVQSLSRK
ncbi:bifunctional 4-hydroxy-2-oxoglutarate aldolase/2-dehydro-3-deoxy-phosphogluconate aldolase [Cytophagaceae bacterium DM2B3-1]|uniref:Bifunctional 4-hydroxy-2-oxoglutarate aldolase/2-dehydro-3-deoxy-phosphogluconate aldolase n=1 Tax=Xanthocytophaga flava TaxID=3048013 RepID=A0ABT7CP96_9BACT|nr:bifunctional 4-hydroxy-2-oxoglutarate aldolase/2-dehydro-3-deoxy-phosphogluconate aldolase [Xanthocytophaga flavus]MDJ1495571.1 bifunctional 4-hydroxy-2-oxoglutarate aldolase/2-dehydro-3-deoxy-phosphogluconate aldolase [Xanthocytophaga flavus]